MDAANLVGAIEIGQCTGYPEHTVVAAGPGCVKSRSAAMILFESADGSDGCQALRKGLTGAKAHFFPAVLDDYVAEDNPVRAVDAFVEGLDLGGLGFGRAERTRSRASETALSGKPTMVKAGIPGATWTCTSTGRTSMPSNATVDTRWTISPSLPVSADTTGSRAKVGDYVLDVPKIGELHWP